MKYITVMQSPRYKSMSLDDLFFGGDDCGRMISSNYTNTRTYEVNQINRNFRRNINTFRLIRSLTDFNSKYSHLYGVERQSLYRSFHIPKKSGGLRKIDAPNDDLMEALKELKSIFENEFHALYHTSAFAYVKHRSTIECMKRHQANDSKWFAKFDLHNFFGSITLEWTLNMISCIFPFSEVMATSDGKSQLTRALSLAFLNGGLPQGTPISPLITNILMIPIDYTLSNALREYSGSDKEKPQKFVYTRYADDFQISSRYNFDYKKIESLIIDTLRKFDAPFSINQSKTRYGSSSGRNWNLGVMLNKDNEITVGHKKKKQFKLMMSNYIMDKKNGKEWDISDIQTLDGYRNYYKMVEGEVIDRMLDYLNTKFECDVMSMIKEDLRK